MSSSVVILNSKSSLKELEEAFESISVIAEEELWVSVEFAHGSNSFWTPTPDEEESEEEITGIIDIGDDQEVYQKIISLAHEIGHALHRRDEHMKGLRYVIFSESLAWFLGYKWCVSHGYIIDIDEYNESLVKALKLYVATELE
jgi:hypothetical protein